MDLFKSIIKGYISFFRGAPSYVFPEMKLKYVKCEMSDFQYASYKAVLRNEENISNKKTKKKVNKNLNVGELPNNFFIGPRIISNVAYPNKDINEKGFSSWTGSKLKLDNGITWSMCHSVPRLSRVYPSSFFNNQFK